MFFYTRQFPKAIAKPSKEWISSREIDWRTIPYYEKMLFNIVIHESAIKVASKLCRGIFADYARYQIVGKALEFHPAFVGAIHYLEANRNWKCNLHNGERWDRVTRLVPRGKGPFDSWEEAAIDALIELKRDMKYGSLEEYLLIAEKHNGLGYLYKNNASPYIFSGTNRWLKGKFVADGSYDPDATTGQVGLATILLVGEIIGVWKFERYYTARKTKDVADWAIVQYAPDTYSQLVEAHQKCLNEMLKIANISPAVMLPVKVDGKAGPLTSALHKELFGVYLNGDSRNK